VDWTQLRGPMTIFVSWCIHPRVADRFVSVIETQPAVGPPVLSCKKIPDPAPQTGLA